MKWWLHFLSTQCSRFGTWRHLEIWYKNWLMKIMLHEKIIFKHIIWYCNEIHEVWKIRVRIQSALEWNWQEKLEYELESSHIWISRANFQLNQFSIPGFKVRFRILQSTILVIQGFLRYNSGILGYKSGFSTWIKKAGNSNWTIYSICPKIVSIIFAFSLIFKAF